MAEIFKMYNDNLNTILAQVSNAVDVLSSMSNPDIMSSRVMTEAKLNECEKDLANSEQIVKFYLYRLRISKCRFLPTLGKTQRRISRRVRKPTKS